MATKHLLGGMILQVGDETDQHAFSNHVLG